jgi:hypothetical protein
MRGRGVLQGGSDIAYGYTTSKREAGVMFHYARLIVGSILMILAALPAKAEDKFFDSAGVKIRYIEQGNGPPVILLHGYSVDIESQWVTTGVVETLAKNYRVIAMDARGHGKSGKPHDPNNTGPRWAATSLACSTISVCRRRTSSATRWARISWLKCLPPIPNAS